MEFKDNLKTQLVIGKVIEHPHKIIFFKISLQNSSDTLFISKTLPFMIIQAATQTLQNSWDERDLTEERDRR